MSTEIVGIGDIDIKEVRNSNIGIHHVWIKQDDDVIIITIKQVNSLIKVLNNIITLKAQEDNNAEGDD